MRIIRFFTSLNLNSVLNFNQNSNSNVSNLLHAMLHNLSFRMATKMQNLTEGSDIQNFPKGSGF